MKNNPLSTIFNKISGPIKTLANKSLALIKPVTDLIAINFKKLTKRLSFLSVAVNRRVIMIAAIVVVAIYLIGGAVFAVGVYKLNWTGKSRQFGISAYPFPAAYVGGHIIWYKSFQREYDHANFFAIKTDKVPSDEKEFKKSMLDQMVDLEIWKTQARKNGVNISTDAYNSSYKQLIDQAGGEDKAKEMLKEFWGMDLSDLKRLIRDQLPKEKLTEKLQNEILVSVRAQHILVSDENLAKEVASKAKAGTNFADLAKEYTQDTSTKEQGGELGFFTRGVMDPDFEKAAFALKVGDISDPVKSQFGYHIIHVEERKGTIDKSADAWFNDIKKETKIYKFVGK